MKLYPLLNLGVETLCVYMFITINILKFYQHLLLLYILHYHASKYGYLPHCYLKMLSNTKHLPNIYFAFSQKYSFFPWCKMCPVPTRIYFPCFEFPEVKRAKWTKLKEGGIKPVLQQSFLYLPTQIILSLCFVLVLCLSFVVCTQ